MHTDEQYQYHLLYEYILFNEEKSVKYIYSCKCLTMLYLLSISIWKLKFQTNDIS